MLTKAKLNNIKISHISYNQFVSVNMLRKYDDIKEAIKNVKSQTVIKDFRLFIKLYCLKCRKNKETKKPKVKNNNKV